MNTPFSFNTDYDDNTHLKYDLQFDVTGQKMDYNYTFPMDDNELNRFRNISKFEHVDIKMQAMSHVMFKIGK